MSDSQPKINKKKLENLERLRRKKEAKISKSKAKKLAQISERKRIKQTRESLFEMLQQYQLDDSKMKLLNSIAGTSSKVQAESESGGGNRSNAPKKLRCVSADKLRKETDERKQINHIETDSSSCEDLTEEQQQKTVQGNEEQIVDQKLSDNSEENDVEIVLQKALPATITQPKSMQLFKKKKQNENSVLKTSCDALECIKGRQVIVNRSAEIMKQIMKLPINAEEQPIVEAINENPVVIICGETGSGKTTQIPQFLYEAGYTSNGHLIGITEPRRIAAISMAARVGQELGDPGIASYQIRYEGNRTEATKILFMTDGVLLKELQSDCTLSRYSVVIIDEAHERSLYSDVLIGLLSRICAIRLKRGYPLKLIIMSATLRLQDFLREKLFANIQPKVINIEARQFPVSIYFERRTPTNYLEAIFRKVCKIHEEYPIGGILVFVTGQQEVMHLIKLLSHRYQKRKGLKRRKQRRTNEFDCSEEPVTRRSEYENSNEEDMELDNEEFGTYDMDDCDDLINQHLMEEDADLSPPSNFPPLIPIPLYSLLPVHLQKRVFEPIEDGARMCVISTNVAETSITIPDVRYVVDCGKEKRRECDPITGVSRFVVDWCSKSSAKQRSGRAGRTHSGYAFRLYSSAVYEDMKDYSVPEILNKPMDQLVLLLKSMNFDKIANFPFPTPPNADQINSAELRLTRLGAMKACDNRFLKITPLGRTLAQLPLAPVFAKFVVTSLADGLLPYAITLVSALSVREPLMPIHSPKNEESTSQQQKEKITEMLQQRRLWCALGEARMFADLTVLLNIIGAADYAEDNNSIKALGLRPKALNEINKVRKQLVHLLNEAKSVEELSDEFRMEPPSQEQLKKLRHKMVKCLPDKIAKKVYLPDAPKGAYKTQILEDFVFIDSSSMLYKEQPDFVLYQEIVQLADKKCLQHVCAVDPVWIPDFVHFEELRSFR